MRETRRFSEQEDAYIRANSGRTSATAISRHLGRNPASVVSRQVTLGLRVPNRTVRKFSSAEDRIIREGAGIVSMYEIAERLGRKPSSCYGRAKALGIGFAPTQRKANRRIRGGYWWIPLVVNGRRVWKQEHRHVMEKHLGRPLCPKERVHHIDLDPTNNRIENLYLCRTESAHRGLHNRLEKLLGSAEVVKRLLELDILTFDHAGGNYVLCETIK